MSVRSRSGTKQRKAPAAGTAQVDNLVRLPLAPLVRPSHRTAPTHGTDQSTAPTPSSSRYPDPTPAVPISHSPAPGPRTIRPCPGRKLDLCHISSAWFIPSPTKQPQQSQERGTKQKQKPTINQVKPKLPPPKRLLRLLHRLYAIHALNRPIRVRRPRHALHGRQDIALADLERVHVHVPVGVLRQLRLREREEPRDGEADGGERGRVGGLGAGVVEGGGFSGGGDAEGACVVVSTPYMAWLSP